MQTKKMLILFGTHGDEIHLKEALTYIHPEYARYFDYLVVNEQACDTGVRFITYDMNRYAPGDMKSASYELRRCAEIISLSKEYELVIDIHGTDAHTGLFTIVTKGTSQNIISSLSLTSLPTVVWQSGLNNDTGPLTQYMHHSFEIECGPNTDNIIYQKLGNELNQIIEKFCGLREVTACLGDLLCNDVYLVVHKVDKRHLFDGDLREIGIRGETYYPILTKNNYDHIGAYLCKKMKFGEMICDIVHRIDTTCRYLE